MENTITIIINNFVDYKNLTEMNFCEQNLNYDLMKIKKIEMPNQIKWAQGEIDEIQNLYHKNLISNIKML